MKMTSAHYTNDHRMHARVQTELQRAYWTFTRFCTSKLSRCEQTAQFTHNANEQIQINLQHPKTGQLRSVPAPVWYKLVHYLVL